MKQRNMILPTDLSDAKLNKKAEAFSELLEHMQELVFPKHSIETFKGNIKRI